MLISMLIYPWAFISAPLTMSDSRVKQAMRAAGGANAPQISMQGGQDYIFALPFFDSFTTYDQLKLVGN